MTSETLPKLNLNLKGTILIYDDSEDVIAYVAALALQNGYQVFGARTFQEFKEIYKPDISIIMIDLIMPGHDGIEVLRYLNEIKCTSGIILSSSQQESVLKAGGRLAQSLNLPFMGWLNKPYIKENIIELLESEIPKPKRKRVQKNKFTRNDVRRCIAKNEIVVFYQPKIDVESLQFVSCESLVRWQHPEMGILGPGAFLPLVEELDMIGAMTTLIVEKAFDQVTKWNDLGIFPNLAINISARSFSDLQLPEQLVSLSKKYNIPTHKITLEITESWKSHDPISALDIMTRLRLKGFNLSIDDFGTGYSSMTQLKQAPFTELKLDQSFVRGAANDERSRAIVEACINLGQNLGLHVVAEGVEKQSDWDLVTELGCDECQGYFVARPMPGENVPLWLDRWNTSLGINYA